MGTQRHDEPNSAGFAGDPATPTPAPGDHQSAAERVAIPADDLTRAAGDAAADAVDGDERS